jgi:predicted nucleic acid-binding protein
VTTLLLDASVLLAAFDPEDGQHESARALLEDDEVTLATLDLARYEVTNVAVRAWRAPESVAPLLAVIDKLADDGGVLASSGSLLTRAAEIAERHTISVYDAAYSAAADAGHRLVSCDERDLVSKGLAALPARARRLEAGGP